MRPLPVLLVAALISLSGSASAGPSITCTYDEPSKTVTLTGADAGLSIVFMSAEAGVIMWQGQVAVPRARVEEPCGTATTSNTDLIRIQGGGPDGFFVAMDESTGNFAPGATVEPTGVSEIEIEFNSPGGLLLIGMSPDPRVMRLGTLGANINGDDDVDVTIPVIPLGIGLFGGPAADDIAGTGGFATGDPATIDFVADGGDGADLLVAGSGRSGLNGGPGDDLLVGGPAADLVTAGDGNDRVTGGAGADGLQGQGGNDRILGGSGKDRINGGRGRDRCVGGPGKDLLEKCNP